MDEDSAVEHLERVAETGYCRSANERAGELGLEVRRPEADELFIDIDSWEALTEFERRLPFFKKVNPFTIHPSRPHKVMPSKTPGHFHVVVFTVKPVKSEVERVLLQLLLGSDLKRETRAYFDLTHGDSRDASVFFEEPKDFVEAPPSDDLPY